MLNCNRYIDFDLAEKLREYDADLVILEGMGRAIHTNYLATFSCDCIKTAVIKNRWLATRLGGDMFSVIFKYERCMKQERMMESKVITVNDSGDVVSESVASDSANTDGKFCDTG